MGNALGITGSDHFKPKRMAIGTEAISIL
jgi:hypothetical protein